MKLAINYSEEAESLIEKGQIELDLFKCAEIPELVTKASRVLPVTVHFNLTVGNQSLQFIDWDIVDHLFKTTQTFYINLHLEARSKNYPDIPIESAHPSYMDNLIERILQEIQPVLKRYPEKLVIFENAIYRGEDGEVLKASVIPEVFSQLMQEIDCGLLLDISHARITAKHLGMDERDYISRLPVKKLKEVHFTGLHNINGKWVDHLEILDDDWPILEWVIRMIKSDEFSIPWLLVFEYGGVGDKYKGRSEPEIIASQIPRIHKLIK